MLPFTLKYMYNRSMCGIAGFYNLNNQKLLKEFSKELEHRGPDGEGMYINSKVNLLSRRLAIIDRKGGDQPIYNEDKSLVIVFNGEIYNYQELTEDLKKKNHIFKTHSDTEAIIHLYEEYGEDCFEKLNGMFTVAIYDTKKEKLVLARDHFGIKPLYYVMGATGDKADMGDKGETGKALLFSSEIKPLLKSGYIKPEVNEKILYRYLRYRIHDDTEETFFNGIHRLLPGQMLTIQNETITKKSYLSSDWPKKMNLQDLSESEIIERFKKQLYEAVRLRLISEVPVGTSFSGGLDSSAVVAIVNKLLKDHVKETESVGKKQNTFSAIFPGSTNDEEEYVDAVIEKIGDMQLNVHKIQPDAQNFFDEIKDFVRTQEEPTISTGPYAQYCVMKVATQHVTVLLDGQGSDEMMAGYLPYYFVYLKELMNEKNYSTLLKEIITSGDVISKFGMLKIKQKLGFDKNIDPDSLFNKQFVEKNKSSFVINHGNLQDRLMEDLLKNSLQSLLRYEDKNTMRFSLEGRVPFLDFNLLSLIISLPRKFIIRNGWNKYILREAVRDILPEKVVNRRNKIGFTTPEYQWFMEKHQHITQVFKSKSFASRPYFNQANILTSWQDFIDKKNTDTLLFWRLLNTELWLREFID